MSAYQNGSSGSSAVNGHKSETPARTADSNSKHWERLATQTNPKPTPLELKPTPANRNGVANAFERFPQVIQSTVQPLPNQQGAGTFSENGKWGKFRNDITTLRLAGKLSPVRYNGMDGASNHLKTDYKTLKAMVVAKLKGEKLKDDKTMIMEKVIQLVSNLPSNSKTRTELTNTFLSELWYSLEHPPSLYVGEKFQYRQADGSYNVCAPKMSHSEQAGLLTLRLEHHVSSAWRCRNGLCSFGQT